MFSTILSDRFLSSVVIYDIKLGCTYFAGLERHLEDAQKRKDKEEAEYVQKMVSFVGE